MSVKELSEAIASAISQTLSASVDARLIERSIAQEIGSDGVNSFDVKGYVDSFLADNKIEPNQQLLFRVRWLPVLQLLADRSLKRVSSNRLQLFETAVSRALGTASTTITREFNNAWEAFTKSPADRNAYLRVMAELKSHGVQNALLSRLNGAWTNLFVTGDLGGAVLADEVGPLSPVEPVSKARAVPATHYEAIDRGTKTFYVRTPASSDAVNVSLAGYRISELRAAHQNAMASPASIVSAYPGFDASGSFLSLLAKGLLNSGFEMKTQDFLHPNISEIEQFNRESDGKKRVLIFKITGDVSAPYDGYVLEFLRDRFLSGEARKHGVSRVIFMIDTNGATTVSAASSLSPYLKQILNRTVDVPAVGINPKELNERQAGELLYGSNVWSGKSAASVGKIVSLVREQLPMLPAALTNLRPVIQGLKTWDQISGAIIGYGTRLRRPRPDDINKLLLTSMLPTDDSRWYRTRLHTLEGRYSVRNPSAKDEPFERFDIRVAVAGSSSSDGGSKRGSGGAVAKSGSTADASQKGADVPNARGWKGFCKIPADQLAPPPGMPPMLAEELDGLFDPEAAVKTTLPGAVPTPLGGLPAGTSKPITR